MICPRRAAGILAEAQTVMRSQSLYNEVTTLVRVCSSLLLECLIHPPAILKSCHV